MNRIRAGRQFTPNQIIIRDGLLKSVFENKIPVRKLWYERWYYDGQIDMNTKENDVQFRFLFNFYERIELDEELILHWVGGGRVTKERVENIRIAGHFLRYY